MIKLGVKLTKNSVRLFLSAILLLCMLISLYIGLLIGIETYAATTSDQIQTQKQLNEHLEIEKRKLNTENLNISAKFEIVNDTSYSTRVGENQYEIVLSKRGQNVATLKHELYHIVDGHCDDDQGVQEALNIEDLKFKIKYLFNYELKAALYSFKEWKL